MATCKDCLHYDVCKSYGVIMHNSMKLKMTEEVESKCPYKLFKSKTIKTNADRIRAMSDEELAEFLDGKEWDCSTYKLCDQCPLYDKEKVCLSTEEWLQQPAEDRL